MMRIVFTFKHALPVSTFKQKSLICPECGKTCHRNQEMERHFSSFHLPCWIFCPYSGCGWRGDRLDEFDKHLATRKCGPKPEELQYQIYNVKMVLSWIRNSEGGDVISTAKNIAVDLVKERALVLGRQDWLKDPWGRAEKQARRERAESQRS
jgi:hypothetical protein